MSGKVDKKKWTTNSVVYSPVEDEIAVVLVGIESGHPDSKVLLRDSGGLRTVTVQPVGTRGSVTWAYLGKYNGN